MKEWKRKIASLLMVSMLLGSYGQTAVYAAEPEGGEVVVSDDQDGVTAEDSDTDEEEEAADIVIPDDTDEKADNDGTSDHSAMDSQPGITADTASLTLVKGQKFVLSNNNWTSSDKKILAISKTKATAKKAGTVKLIHNDQIIDVTVVEPSFESKTVKMIANHEKTVSLNNVAGLNVQYISLAPDVAYVDGDGNLLALSKGSTVINAYVNGVQFKYTVKVADVDTTKKDFTNTVDLKPMQSVNIKLSGFKASKAVWKSDTMVSANEVPKGYVFEDAVVRINKKGRITAIGEGTTELTASGGSTEPVKITIHVYGPSTKVMYIYAGDTKPLKLYGVKGNVDWKPQKEGDTLVKVEKNKVKAGTTSGITTLDAEVEGFKYTAVIFVMDATIRNEGVSKKGNKYTLEMNSGSTLQLAYMAVYQNVILKSSDCSVAYADENCIIHARKKGSAKLSGKINGKAITVTVKVEGNDKPDKDLELHLKEYGFTVYGYGSERYSDTDKSVYQNLPKPYKVLWHAKLPNPEFPAENLAYVRLVEIEDEMVSMDVFYSVYTGVNMLCSMEVACEVIDKLVNDPYVETTEGEGPFYYFPPYSQYIKYDLADFY